MTWHQLFDQACRSAGHRGNSVLATELCRMTNRRSEADHRTAVRNIANWRQGKHLPNRSALAALESLLNVEADPDLAEKWRALYEMGRSTGAQERTCSTAPINGEPHTSSSLVLRRPAVLLACLAVAALSLAAWKFAFEDLARVAETGVDDRSLELVPYLERIRLAPGMSAVVHGARGVPCGSSPPDWDEVRSNLPALRVGAWSDGGMGFRVSKSCAGVVPVRAVVVTATREGRDDVLLFGDPVTVEVEQ